MDDDAPDFAAFPLLPELAAVIDELGFTQPTPIQAQAIPLGLAGRDVIGKAQTGTGKTLAFGLPLVQKLDPTRGAAQACVLLPTRELAQQVVQHLEPFAQARGMEIILVVGGERVMQQRQRIPGKQIVVGTPGRMLDFLRDGALRLEWVTYLVLDEFDRMLDMGFIEDVERIVSYVPQDRQTMLFSATIPPQSLPQARTLTRDPVRVEVGTGLQAADTVIQAALRVPVEKKLELLVWLLRRDVAEEGRTVMVFSNTRRCVSDLERELWGRDLPSSAISGDYDQEQRFRVMDGFRNGRIRILVATEGASRGLDVEHVGHVINYDVPLEVEDYVHRLGRTGRAGRKGQVTTLVEPRQERYFRRILARFQKRIRVGHAVGGAPGRGPRADDGPSRGAGPGRRPAARRGQGRGGRPEGRSGRRPASGGRPRRRR